MKEKSKTASTQTQLEEIVAKKILDSSVVHDALEHIHSNNKPIKNAYIFIGAPVCGKDTQTEAWEAIGLPVLNMGRTLRERALQDPLLDKVMSDGGLAEDSAPIWIGKRWILKHTQEKIIALNGIPRNTKQLGEIINFLRERGFEVHVVRFTTPATVCMKRPFRSDRKEDTFENRLKRMRVYLRETRPIDNELITHGIHESNRTLLQIDNTTIQKQETAERIIQYFNLPFTAEQLFPTEEAGSSQRSDVVLTA